MAFHDVIIAGAGPAGSICAQVLGNKGVDVLLLDKEKFPRYKPCGGGIVKRAMDLLKDVMGKITEAELHSKGIVENQVRRIAFHYHPLGKIFWIERPYPLISMVDREKFDQWLLERALSQGIGFRDGCKVKGFERSAGITVFCDEQVYRCRFLVMAAGWSNLGLKQGKHYRNIMPAFECRIRPAGGIIPAIRDSARFDMGYLRNGYFWSFPKSDYLSVGVASTQKSGANLKAYLAQYLESLEMNEAMVDQQHGFAIPVFPRTGLFDDPNVLYVGDAAGLADPVVAEGITHALLSGHLAAEALLEGNLAGDKVLELYRNKLSEKIMPQLKIARKLAHIFYHHPVISKLALKKIGYELTGAVANIFEGNGKYPDQYSTYLKALEKIIFH